MFYIFCLKARENKNPDLNKLVIPVLSNNYQKSLEKLKDRGLTKKYKIICAEKFTLIRFIKLLFKK